ncbi:odorant receptor 121-1 [Danio rerio]|uniref:Olfactory receptor n=1 Tax=Danio rerio TaxID=7955 RepID=Q2PRE8_DANRE|nr:odorant receptor 121-1 [Danio rerio]ABC43319.1 odorant receptor [Danio rerio]|eukprot:NP_001124287.1 odorant receptor, family E, subfamily 121, member 1 [Danio rerio]
MENGANFTFIRLTGYLNLDFKMKYFLFAVLTVLYSTIIFANSFLIGVICLAKILHKPMYMFLCSLFVNELYGSTALFPSLQVNLLLNDNTISLVYCYLQIFCLYTYAMIEFCNLAVMSFDRYVSICYPLQYNRIMTPVRVGLLIALVWIYCFIQFFIFLSFNFKSQLCGNVMEKVWCDNYLLVKLACSKSSLNNIYGIYLAVVTAVIPLALIFYSYTRIIKICLSFSKEAKKKALSTCTPHIISLLNFTLGWLFEILQSRFDDIKMPALIRVIISVYFLMCQPLLNPILYGVRLKNIRLACKNFVLSKIGIA